MRAALSIPAQYEAPAQSQLEAANDSYSEVTVGGIATACLSRDGLARMMLQDCLDARSNPNRQPKLVFASNGHAIAFDLPPSKWSRDYHIGTLEGDLEWDAGISLRKLLASYGRRRLCFRRAGRLRMRAAG